MLDVSLYFSLALHAKAGLRKGHELQQRCQEQWLSKVVLLILIHLFKFFHAKTLQIWDSRETSRLPTSRGCWLCKLQANCWKSQADEKGSKMKQSTLNSKQKYQTTIKPVKLHQNVLFEWPSRLVLTNCRTGHEFDPVLGMHDLSMLLFCACLIWQPFGMLLLCLFDTFKLSHERKNSVIRPRSRACQCIYCTSWHIRKIRM